MKRIFYVALAGVVMAATTAGAQSQSQPESQPAAQPQSQPQSLGDYARALRKQKDKSKETQLKQYDNDNLPRDTAVSVVGNAPSGSENSAASGSAAASGEQSASASNAPAAQSGPTSEKDKEKMYGDWKAKIAAQKDKVDLLTRELDVLQREYKLRAAVFYADAGNRLRNSTDWDKEDAQYKQQIADKQKALDDAKLQLAGILEDARKAGVPASMRE